MEGKETRKLREVVVGISAKALERCARSAKFTSRQIAAFLPKEEWEEWVACFSPDLRNGVMKERRS